MASLGISARMQAAIRRGRPIRLLADIDHPSGYVRVWTGTGEIVWRGETYLGVGRLGRVTPVQSTTDISIPELAFELSGVPPEGTALLSDRVRGRRGALWLACVEPPRRVVPDPCLLAELTFDVQQLDVQENGLSVVRLIGQAGLVDLERAVDIAWSSEQANHEFGPGVDTGWDMIPSFVTRDVVWART